MTFKAPILKREVVLRLEMPIGTFKTTLVDENELSFLLRWMQRTLGWTLDNLAQMIGISKPLMDTGRTVSGVISLDTLEKIHNLIWVYFRLRVPLHDLSNLAALPVKESSSAWFKVAGKVRARAMGAK